MRESERQTDKQTDRQTERRFRSLSRDIFFQSDLRINCVVTSLVLSVFSAGHSHAPEKVGVCMSLMY